MSRCYNSQAHYDCKLIMNVGLRREQDMLGDERSKWWYKESSIISFENSIVLQHR